ncbi:MAG: hypothetical protein GY929_03020 [Actinomycetia bacterium]|nr:hypothetical protein [Actinomycetes bacterium]
MRLASTPGGTGPSRARWSLAVRRSTAWSTQDPVWPMGEAGLIASSEGHYDAATYEHQVGHGID